MSCCLLSREPSPFNAGGYFGYFYSDLMLGQHLVLAYEVYHQVGHFLRLLCLQIHAPAFLFSYDLFFVPGTFLLHSFSSNGSLSFLQWLVAFTLHAYRPIDKHPRRRRPERCNVMKAITLRGNTMAGVCGMIFHQSAVGEKGFDFKYIFAFRQITVFLGACNQSDHSPLFRR